MFLIDFSPAPKSGRATSVAAEHQRAASLLFAVIVYLAAIPFLGVYIPSAWLFGNVGLIIAERYLDRRHGRSAAAVSPEIFVWLLNLSLSLAAAYLVFFEGAAKTFGACLFGVIMFKTLAQHYADRRRLLIHLIPPVGSMFVVQGLATVMLVLSNQPQRILTVVLTSGLILWVLWTITLDLRRNFEGFFRESQRAEASVRRLAANQRLTLLAEDLAGISHWQFDCQTRRSTWSHGIFKLTGLDPEQGEPDLALILDVFAPQDRQRIAQLTTNAIRHGRPFACEAGVVRSDGATRTVTLNGAVERDADGRVATVFGTIMDITEQRAQSEALRENEARLRMLSDHTTELVIWFGPDRLLRYVSPSCRRLGYDPETLIGQDGSALVHPDERESVRQSIDDMFRTGRTNPTVRGEYRVRTMDGDYVWLEAAPTLVEDSQTGEDTCISSYRDVSARRQLEEDLIQAKLRAEEAANVKAEFLANMSHEIRTPLTAVIGYAGLLRAMDGLPEAARSHVHRISTGGNVLLGLVNEILDLARMEQNDLQLNTAPFSLRDLLSDVIAMVEPIADEKQLAMELVLDDASPNLLEADSARLRQVVVNLVNNAIKFTDQGRVTINARFDAQAERLHVSVADTGIGVPADKLNRLFQRFSQVDGSVNRKHGGTGLGLSICRRLVQLMGGEIHVNSTVGSGSTFHFWISARAAPERRQADPESRKIPPADPDHSFNILVVDDVAVNRELVRAILEAVGQNVTVADGGAAAVAVASRQTFDLIFMDLQMPGMDGYEACRRLRADGGPNARTPIIALSANVLEEHRIATQAAGMNDHVAKPIVPADLLRAVERWSRRRAAAPAEPTASNDQSLVPPRTGLIG